MIRSKELATFYRGRRVVVTGHTGFKGAWLALWLHKMGAHVLGIALPPTSPLSGYVACDVDSLISTETIDIRQASEVRSAIEQFKPEIVFHLAAQAIVGTAFHNPAETFDVNVMGSIHVMDAVRATPEVKALIMVTSDKCYENVEQIWGYRETDRLGGKEPYGVSKACVELATTAYAASYFSKEGTASVASVRSGNVVGGGDWSDFRLIPDCIRSLRENRPIGLRSPRSTRPWQFVLEPLLGYLLLAQKLTTEGKAWCGGWNFGPAVNDTNDVERCARAILDHWGSGSIESSEPAGFHESGALQLDSTKAAVRLGWRPALSFDGTMKMTASWYRQQYSSPSENMHAFSLSQIEAFENLRP